MEGLQKLLDLSRTIKFTEGPVYKPATKVIFKYIKAQPPHNPLVSLHGPISHTKLLWKMNFRELRLREGEK